MPDTALIDRADATHLPLRLRFWRPVQVRVKHRNPLFNPAIGVTPILMAPDQLHAFNLGPMLVFARDLLWIMMWSSVWSPRGRQDQTQWIEQSLIPMRSELEAWQLKFQRDHPSHKGTKIQKITGHVVGKPAARTLNLKAAEVKYFFFFLHSKLLNVSHRLHQGDLWLAASTALYNLVDEMSGMPWKVSDDQDEDRTSPAQYYSHQRIW